MIIKHYIITSILLHKENVCYSAHHKPHMDWTQTLMLRGWWLNASAIKQPWKTVVVASTYTTICIYENTYCIQNQTYTLL